jgi:hypothetical protein
MSIRVVGEILRKVGSKMLYEAEKRRVVHATVPPKVGLPSLGKDGPDGGPSGRQKVPMSKLLSPDHPVGRLVQRPIAVCPPELNHSERAEDQQDALDTGRSGRYIHRMAGSQLVAFHQRRGSSVEKCSVLMQRTQSFSILDHHTHN